VAELRIVFSIARAYKRTVAMEMACTCFRRRRHFA